ncbi:MAG: hypothetical protein RSC49_05390 [Clostridium sp.]
MNTIKMVLRRIILLYILSFIFIVVISLISLKNTADSTPYIDGVLLYKVANKDIGALIPFFLLPCIYGYIYYSDKKNGFCDYIGSRVSISKYKLSILIVTFFLCFLLVFVSERIVFYAAVLLKGNIVSLGTPFDTTVLPPITLGSPYIDSILLAAWRAGILAIYSICAVVLSFNTKSFFVIATGGILYRFLSDLIGTITPFFGYTSLVAAGSLDGFPQVSMFQRIVCLTLFILFIILVNFIGSIKRRKELI